MVLQRVLEPGYWSSSKGHVLCLGAGGSGLAITVNLLSQESSNQPQKIIIVSRNQAALDKLRAIVDPLAHTVEMRYVLNEDPHRNDQLLSELPPGSMVINATGMGKDRPGSPITDKGVFPMRGIAWELNYRGKLDFLHQAEAQRGLRSLIIEDGWRYFIISWKEHIADVFHIQVSPAQIDQLAEIASTIRGGV
jgi:shikimate 5-dehydrogenase